jgi:hypothetical protein
VKVNKVLAALLGLSALPLLANTFTFSSNIDATPYGLSASTPLTIQWSYDPSQTPYPGSNADYLMDFTISVGGYVVLGHGDLMVVTPPGYDQFELGAAGFVSIGPSYQESLTGFINGFDVNNASLNILNNVAPINMFSSTALPASAGFINSANFIQVEIENYNGTRHIVQQYGPGSFTFTESDVPEPASIALLAFPLALIALLVIRRQSVGEHR